MRKLLAVSLLTLIGSATALQAQPGWERPQVGSFRFFGEGIGLSSRFFPASKAVPRFRGSSPFFLHPFQHSQLVDTRPSGYPKGGFFSSGFHQQHAPGRYWISSTAWPWGYGAPILGEPAPRASWSFVDQWRDRLPAPQRKNALAASPLLREGMDEADVMARLGSPLARIKRGEEELWTYSGYRLSFRGQKLSGLE